MPWCESSQRSGTNPHCRKARLGGVDSAVSPSLRVLRRGLCGLRYLGPELIARTEIGVEEGADCRQTGPSTASAVLGFPMATIRTHSLTLLRNAGVNRSCHSFVLYRIGCAPRNQSCKAIGLGIMGLGGVRQPVASPRLDLAAIPPRCAALRGRRSSH